MIKAVIFDCFGVLVGDGLQLVCQDLETSDPEARAFIGDMIYQSNIGALEPGESGRLISERLGMSETAWRELVSRGEVRNDDAVGLVRSLRGRYQTALLSNIGKGSLKRRFSDDELAELFDVVVPSAEVGMLKPDPRIYEYTAGQLGVLPEECVFIDDREEYVEAAKRVGMRGICFKSAAQTRRDLEAILY